MTVTRGRFILTAAFVLLSVSGTVALEISSKKATGTGAISAEMLERIEPELVYIRDMEKRMLRYFILRSDFSDSEGDRVAANLARAGQNWTDICTECGIHFIEVLQSSEADFQVVAAPRWSAVMAKAFYPTAAQKDWKLMIARTYFNESSHYDKIGVLRHELGHILGYRHEQSVAEPEEQKTCGWYKDAVQVRLTGYDPQSIMHYPCSSFRGNTTFGFSACDIAAHRRIYSPASIAKNNDASRLTCADKM